MTGTDRLHSLDAARAIALLCGIVLHATMSFSRDWAATGMPIVDVSPSDTLQGVFHVLHSFRMLLFFLMAGFFGNLLLQHRGFRGFWRNRLRRIAVPMVVGWVVLMPLLAAPIIWAVFIRDGGLRGDGSGLAAMGGGVPLGHLWFLYYLLLFYAVAVAAIWMLRRLGWSAGPGRVANAATALLLRSHATTVLMPLPIALVLATSSSWVPWTGIPSPLAGPLPQPGAVVAFGSAFLLGWMLYRQRDLLQVWSASWVAHAVLAGAASAASIWMLGAPGDQQPFSDSRRLAYALVYTFGGWSWVVAITGFCLRKLSAPSKSWRYLADASYWMYLVHLPLVLALQVVVMRWPLHWSIKYPLIVAATFALLWLSYRYLVRGTFIGAWLNGKRMDCSIPSK